MSGRLGADLDRIRGSSFPSCSCLLTVLDDIVLCTISSVVHSRLEVYLSIMRTCVEVRGCLVSLK